MKKRGFTLIELLAVIVILSIIALIAIPIIMNIIDKSNKKAFENSGYGIIKAGELYYSKHSLKEEGMETDREFIFPNNYEGLEIKGSKPVSGNMIISKDGKIALAISNGKYCVRKSYDEEDLSIDEDIKTCNTKEKANVTLVSEIKISNEAIELSPEDKQTIEIEVLPSNATNKNLKWTSNNEEVVAVNNGEISALKEGTTTIKVETIDGSNISKEISIKVIPILTSSNNCIKSTTICPNGTLVNVQVNKKENYNFYVIKDTGTELTLIMDKNLGSRVAWITKEDYIAAGGEATKYGSSGDNSKGPVTALKAVEERTSNWTNIPTMTYTLIDENGNNKYQPIIRNNIRARMMTHKEARSLGCMNSTTNTCKSYLITNLSNLNTEDKPRGYWLSDSKATDTREGYFLHYQAYLTTSIAVTGYGVRPVINMSKSILK